MATTREKKAYDQGYNDGVAFAKGEYDANKAQEHFDSCTSKSEQQYYETGWQDGKNGVPRKL